MLTLFACLVLVVMQGLASAFYRNVGNLWFVRGYIPVQNVHALDQAESFQRQALKWSPISRANRAHVSLARILVRCERLDEAIAIWRSAGLTSEPFLTLELGEALWQTGTTGLALSYWKTVPDLDVFFALRGQYLERGGDTNAALADYRISWIVNDRAHPRKGGALLNFCELLRRQGDIPLAITVCERSRESGNTFWANMVLGVLYSDQHDFATAEGYFRQAQAENPHHARADLWLGLSLARQGRLREAIQFYEQGLALAPDDGWLNYLMGKALWESGLREDARGYLEKSVQFVPDSWEGDYLEDARQLLRQLQP
jgi:tetratricopeptide (TPR) repeat protein